MEFQSEKECYDFEANLTMLKLYLFSSQRVNSCRTVAASWVLTAPRPGEWVKEGGVALVAIRNLEADIRPKKILAGIEVGVVMLEWSHDVRPKGNEWSGASLQGTSWGWVFS